MLDWDGKVGSTGEGGFVTRTSSEIVADKIKKTLRCVCLCMCVWCVYVCVCGVFVCVCVCVCVAYVLFN